MKSHVIIGTAGHVDHGKTALVRALTGIDTDRLAEEKKRGITIELGFAHLDLPDGGRLGIVDVPGHERFIKHMLAGAGGIDLAMLVVAADEGVMPQTVEHFDILRLLDIRHGLVAVTKADLADEAWLALVREDVAALTKGSFLEQAPVVCVSAHTGAGLDELRREIVALAARIGQTAGGVPFRLPVDRVFTMEGFGTVVTGTMIEGTLHSGEEVMLYPARRRARVRNIQVHAAYTEQAFAGQRAAVNLAGIKKSDVARGDTLAPPDSMACSLMADVRLTTLGSAAKTVKTGSRLHFYHGAREMLCKVVLLGADELPPGQSEYAQLRFEEDVALKAGDRFVVRFYSPLVTVGGGVVLDPCPSRHKRDDSAVRAALERRESGSPGEIIEQTVRDRSKAFAELETIRVLSGVPEAEFDAVLAELLAQGRLVRCTDRVVVHADYAKTVRQKLLDILNAFHRAEPLKAGIRREELRSRLLPRAPAAVCDALIDAFAAGKTVKIVNGLVSVFSFDIQKSAELEKLTADIAALYEKAGFSPPATGELAGIFAHKQLDKVLSSMLDSGALVRCDAQIYFAGGAVSRALEMLRAHLAGHEDITLAQFRDLLGTSRKFAVALLEHFDREKITQKVGDVRVLR